MAKTRQITEKSVNLDNQIESLTFKEMKKQLLILLKTRDFRRSGRAVHIWGPPGVGKSSVFWEASQQLNMQFIDVRVALLNPVELRGFPKAEDGVLKWWPPDFMPRQPNCLVLFDELNAAPPTVQACVRPDEIILGANTKIADIKINDIVLSKKGEYQRVTNTFRFPFSGHLVRIKARNLLPIECTPNHPLLVCKRSSEHCISQKTNKPSTRYVYSQPVWKLAQDVSVDDFLLVPKLKSVLSTKKLFFDDYIQSPAKVPQQIMDGVPLDINVAEFLGLYVAEGSSGGQVQFAFSRDEKQLIDKVVSVAKDYFGYAANIKDAKNSYSSKVVFGGTVLSRFLRDHCGHGCHNKKIPDFILYHEDSDIIKAFLRGYFWGDGCPAGGGCAAYISTTSKLLALQIQLLSTRFSCLPHINILPERKGKIRGKEVHSRIAYCIASRQDNFVDLLGIEQKNKKARSTMYYSDAGDYLVVKVNNVTRVPYDGDVYNIETDDHTFPVSNAITHNSTYQILLDGKIGSYTLPDNCYCAAAGNRETDQAVVYNMPSALANRFVHLELRPDLADWKAWAVANNINDKVISFLSYQEDYLFKFDPKVHKKAFCTPRSWHTVSDIIKAADGDILAARPLISGTVGLGASQAFLAFSSLYASLPRAECVIVQGDMSVIMPDTTDKQYAFCGAMVNQLRRMDDKDKPKGVNNFFSYAVKRMKGNNQAEFAAMCFADIMTIPYFAAHLNDIAYNEAEYTAYADFDKTFGVHLAPDDDDKE